MTEQKRKSENEFPEVESKKLFGFLDQNCLLKMYMGVIWLRLGLILRHFYLLAYLVYFQLLQVSQKQRDIAVQQNHDRLLSGLHSIGKRAQNFGHFNQQSDEHFAEFYKNIYSVHKSSKARAGANNLEQLNFSSALFFILSALVTIGYGNVFPVTRAGRLFCICYCMFGIPLLLITTADVAKFFSSGINNLYIWYLTWECRALDKLCWWIFRRKRSTVKDLSDEESMAEYMWRNAESIHYVKVPATWLLLVVIAYACLGSVMFAQYESWSFFDGFYFCIVSVLKVGFGDVLPSSITYVSLSLVYVFLGVIIATMCVNVVGVEYVRKIHFLGRVARANVDYLYLIQKAKFRKKRREAMRSTFSVLTAVNKLPTVKKAPVRLSWTESKVYPVSAKPETPKNFKAVETTPYSIKVAWEPYDSEITEKSPVSFTLAYRIKHARHLTELTICGITGHEYEISGLNSFSIYEISLRAINQYGTSDAVKIVQSTEPETAPHGLKAFLFDNRTVKLTWNEPFKRKADLQKYAIYYSGNADEALENWSKLMVDSSQHEAVISNLEDAEKYSFCICSFHKRGHSPISSCVSVKKPADLI